MMYNMHIEHLDYDLTIYGFETCAQIWASDSLIETANWATEAIADDCWYRLPGRVASAIQLLVPGLRVWFKLWTSKSDFDGF